MDTLRTRLKEQFGKGMNASLGRTIINENLWDEARGLVSDADPQIAFRAAWALQWAMEHHNQPLTDYSAHITQVFLDSRNGSVLRIYSKLLLEIMRKTVGDTHTALRIAAPAFDLLLYPQTKAAVKVWLMEILENLSAQIDYVNENLTECIERLSEAPDCSPAMTSHARRVLRRIKRKQY